MPLTRDRHSHGDWAYISFDGFDVAAVLHGHGESPVATALIPSRDWSECGISHEPLDFVFSLEVYALATV